MSLSDTIIEAVKSIAREKGLHDVQLSVNRGSFKGDNYMGDLFKVTATSSADSISLVVKVSPSYGDRDMLTKVYRKEIDAYEKILPALARCQPSGFRVPKFYKGEVLENEAYLIMEDLTELGYETFDRKKPFDRQHVDLALKCLANYHAACFVLKNKHKELYDEFAKLVAYEMIYEIYDVVPDDVVIDCKEKVISSVEDEDHKKKMRKFLYDPETKPQTIFDKENTEPYNILIHGDCWTANFMYKYEDNKLVDMILLDWQTMKVGSPLFDLSYLIFLCTDEDLRSGQQYSNMLDSYFGILSSRLTEAGVGEAYPEAIFREHMKKVMPGGLWSASVNLPMILVDDASQNDESDEDWYLKVGLSDNCKKRMNGVVVTFVEHGYI